MSTNYFIIKLQKAYATDLQNKFLQNCCVGRFPDIVQETIIFDYRAIFYIDYDINQFSIND